jgi:hypothetical protein
MNLQIEVSGLNAFVLGRKYWSVLCVSPQDKVVGDSKTPNGRPHQEGDPDHKHDRMEHRPVLALRLLDVRDATHTPAKPTSDPEKDRHDCHAEELVTLPGGEQWGLWDLTGYEIALGDDKPGVAPVQGAEGRIPKLDGALDPKHLDADPDEIIGARMQLKGGTFDTFLPDIPQLAGAKWILEDAHGKQIEGPREYAERVQIDVQTRNNQITLKPLRSEEGRLEQTIELFSYRQAIRMSVSNLPTSLYHNLFDIDKKDAVADHFGLYAGILAPTPRLGPQIPTLKRFSGSSRIGTVFCPPARFTV